jgi:hypothetical protein
MPKYLSGRIKKKDQNKVALTTTRYQHFSLDETEPNLGNPLSGTFQDTPPAGARYQIVSVDGRPGERYWVPVEGGIIPGTITIYDEGNLVGGINSTSQINFTGLAVTAISNGSFTEVKLDIQDDTASKDFNIGVGVTQQDNDAFGYVKNSETITGVGIVTLTNVTGTFSPSDGQLYLGASSPGGQGVGAGKTPTSVTPSIIANVAVAVTISPQYFSENTQLIYNDNNEFNGAGVYWDKSNTRLGVNQSSPSETLDVDGNINVSGSIKVGATIYDSDGDPGTDGQILAKGAGNPGTIDWVRLQSIITGAGGTIGNIQFHGTTGLVQGDDELNFNPYNEFIGIGTNDPAQKFQVGLDGKRYTTKKLTLDGAVGGSGYTAGQLVQLSLGSGSLDPMDIFGTLVYGVPSAGTAITVRNSNYETKGAQWSSFTGSGYRIWINNGNTSRYINSVGNDATIPETTYAGDDVFVVTNTGKVAIGTPNPFGDMDLSINGSASISAGSTFIIGDNPSQVENEVIGDDLIIKTEAPKLSLLSAGSNGTSEIKLLENLNNVKYGGFIKYDGSDNVLVIGGYDNDTEYKLIEAYRQNNTIQSLKFYNDNSLKFEVKDSGAKVTGNIEVTSGTSEFHGDVRFDGNTAGRDIYFDESQDSLYVLNNAELRIGSTADLQIYHDDSTLKTYVGLYSGGGKTLDFVSFDNNLGVSTAMRVTQVNSGDDYNTYVNLYYNGVEKLEVTENGIDISGHVETDTLNVSAASTISNIKIGGLGGNLPNTIDTSSGNLIINANAGSNTIITDSELQIDSTEQTTGNDDGALIVAGGVHIKRDLLVCNDPETIDTIDPVKVGIATITPVDRLQIGSQNEFIPVVNTTTGDLAAPVGDLGTNEITGITISGSGIVIGQEVKSGFHTVGTKISNIVGDTITVDTYATNTGAENNVPITFGIRNDSAVIAIGQTGFVGIGTTSAEAKLDVRGNLQVTGIASVSETVKVGASVTISSSGDIFISGITSVGTGVTISSSGDTFISGITSVGTGVTITPSIGGIAVTGIITATGGFIGTIRSSDIEGDISATNITVAEENSDDTCNVVFVTSSTGTLPPKTNANLTYKSSSGELYSSSFKGDGSLLTGVIGIGTGVELQNNGTSVGAAATINFGSGLDIILSTNSGIATVTTSLSEGSGSGAFANYASHSETANYAYGIVGIGITSYNQVGILTGSHADDEDDNFGRSVACSADGSTIIVGAPEDNLPDSSSYSDGIVYVYDRVGTTFTQVGIITGNDISERFGYSVACSADGENIVIGARYTGDGTAEGAAYVYDRVGNTTSFTQVGILKGTYAVDNFDDFGLKVACSADGSTIMVCAPEDELPGGTGGSGIVYVFDRVGSTFTEVGILTGYYNSSGSFGKSVACSSDGNVIVIGSKQNLSGSASQSGMVYVFDRQYSGIGATFTPVGILTGSHADDANDHFGESVACSADGNSIIVGAYNDELPGSSDGSGLVYVFDREYSVGIGTTFNQVGIITGADTSSVADYFGTDVACSADGNIIVVGAPEDNLPGYALRTGSTYIFNRQGNDFNRVGLFTGSHADSINDEFGSKVACSADGKHIIVGARDDNLPGSGSSSGLVYVFDQDVNTKSLLRSTDEKNIIIESNLTVKGDIKGTADNADRSIFSSFADYASHSETSNGSYNLVGIGSTYSQVGILTGSYASHSSDLFGWSVATSADGNTIVVSAPYDNLPDSADDTGVVYVFDRVGTTFTEVGILTGSYSSHSSDEFGISVTTSADGNTIVVGAHDDKHPDSADDSGVVYVFDRVGNDFNEVGILTGTHASHVDDHFGISVATSADGNTIVVGAYGDNLPDSSADTGVVYVFDRVGTTFTEVGILTGSYADDIGDYFGRLVACSADGNTIIVGARKDNLPGSSADSGLVYVFDRVGTTFTEVGILTGSYASHSSDQFGQSVATSADGNTIIVGAHMDNLPDSDDESGVVYVFDREYTVGIGTTFTEVGILTGTHADDLNDRFGFSVACSADGNIIVVGAYGDELPDSSDASGVAYVFNRQGNNFNEVGILTGTHANNGYDYFGFSVACSADGKHIIASAPFDNLPDSAGDSGVVYVFDQTTVARDAITATDTGVLITGDLNVTGDITAFYTSDERLKDNITPIDNPLSKIISISGNTFDWNQNSNKSGHDVGVIAQEIKEILPEAVVERDNGYLAVDYYKVIPLLIESIKKLSEEKNIITSENDIKYRLIVDDDGNLSTEKV